MNTRFYQSLAFCVVLAAVIGLAVSCTDNGTRATFDSAGVRIAFEKTSFVENVSLVELVVRKVDNDQNDDNDSLLFMGTADVIDGEFQFSPFELPAGPARFLARGLDSEGMLLYEGSAIVNIIGGRNNTINLTLLPAVPMVRIGPYSDEINIGETHSCFLELYNLTAFAQGTFLVLFDPGPLTLKDVTQANTSWGQLSIDVSSVDAGVSISVGRPQGAGDAIPAGVSRLLRLDFEVVDTDADMDDESTEINVEVSRMVNAQGATIPEFSVLRTDNQTLLMHEVSANLSGVITNATNGNPVAGAGLELIGSRASRETSTDAQGRYSFAGVPIGGYQLAIFADGFVDQNVNITLDAGDNTRNFQLSPTASTSTIAGSVVDAQSGSPVVGAEVAIDGTTARTTTTTIDGKFQFTGLPLGPYTIRITANGYIDFEELVTLTEDGIDRSFAISQALGNALYRIILTWGVSPSDLDAHLFVGNEHIYWFNPGSATSPPFIFLDIDDTDGSGPETITIYQLNETGIFAVHNYSGEDVGDTDLKASKGRVDVYQGSTLRSSFNVPTSGSGFWWHVFDFDAQGGIVSRNILTDNPLTDNPTLVPGTVETNDFPLLKKSAHID